MIFDEYHKLFRDELRKFLAKEVNPYAEKWEAEEMIPRTVWNKMGQQGYLNLAYAEMENSSIPDPQYSFILIEELSKTGFAGFAGAVTVHAYMASSHLAKYGTASQKDKYLYPALRGEKILALAITEPGAGSDVASIKSYAKKVDGGYSLSGSKIFITNGFYADTLIVAAKADRGFSLFIVDGSAKGIQRQKLQKMGWHCSDTAALFFDEVFIPEENLIGEEGKGFYYIMDGFQLERWVIAVIALASSEEALDRTINYAKERESFGVTLHRHTNIRHDLARLHTEAVCVRQFLIYVMSLLHEGKEASSECAMAKLKATELSKHIMDSCLQIHGGYGYMKDYGIERMFRDARVNTIIGGTSEIMKEIICKKLLDGKSYSAMS